MQKAKEKKKRKREKKKKTIISIRLVRLIFR
ncbi:hypothetical protein KSS87_016159 [Heliosperma pusillum]|nr:hypothetical protein KSS87_016159 [Heliosperma pusillum]